MFSGVFLLALHEYLGGVRGERPFDAGSNDPNKLRFYRLVLNRDFHGPLLLASSLLAIDGLAILDALHKGALDKRLGLGVVAFEDEVVVAVEAEANILICKCSHVSRATFPLLVHGRDDMLLKGTYQDQAR